VCVWGGGDGTKKDVCSLIANSACDRLTTPSKGPPPLRVPTFANTIKSGLVTSGSNRLCAHQLPERPTPDWTCACVCVCGGVEGGCGLGLRLSCWFQPSQAQHRAHSTGQHTAHTAQCTAHSAQRRAHSTKRTAQRAQRTHTAHSTQRTAHSSGRTAKHSAQHRAHLIGDQQDAVLVTQSTQPCHEAWGGGGVHAMMCVQLADIKPSTLGSTISGPPPSPPPPLTRGWSQHPPLPHDGLQDDRRHIMGVGLLRKHPVQRLVGW